LCQGAPLEELVEGTTLQVKAKTYATPEAFKQALEVRLRDAALRGRVPMNRLRQVLLFERFLDRLFHTMGDRVIAKGGAVLEFRLERARTTGDVDLLYRGAAGVVLEALQEAARLDTGDRLTFSVEADAEQPEIAGDRDDYPGRRFRAQARLAGRPYGAPFGVDVGIGDPLTAEPEIIQGSALLEFIGLARPALRVYPRETHVAEKVHAYTKPRPRENSRVRDLPDIALLAGSGRFEGEQLRAALARTFRVRNTHDLPGRLPDPPESWRKPYERMAVQDDLPWKTLDEVMARARAFVDPALAGKPRTWDPERGWIEEGMVQVGDRIAGPDSGRSR
jgi:hypothetical protein